MRILSRGISFLTSENSRDHGSLVKRFFLIPSFVKLQIHLRHISFACDSVVLPDDLIIPRSWICLFLHCPLDFGVGLKVFSTFSQKPLRILNFRIEIFIVLFPTSLSMADSKGYLVSKTWFLFSSFPKNITIVYNGTRDNHSGFVGISHVHCQYYLHHVWWGNGEQNVINPSFPFICKKNWPFPFIFPSIPVYF